MFWEICNKDFETSDESYSYTPGVNVAVIAVGDAAENVLENECRRLPLYSLKHLNFLVLCDEPEKLEQIVPPNISNRYDCVFILADFSDEDALNAFFRCAENYKKIPTERVICVTVNNLNLRDNYTEIKSVVDSIFYVDDARLLFEPVDYLVLTGMSSEFVGIDFADLFGIFKDSERAFYDKDSFCTYKDAKRIAVKIIDKIEKRRKEVNVNRWNLYVHFLLPGDVGLEFLEEMMETLVKTYDVEVANNLFNWHFDFAGNTIEMSWLMCEVEEK